MDQLAFRHAPYVHPSRIRWFVVVSAISLAGCTTTLQGFSPDIRETYQLRPEQLVGVQFYVGIVDTRGRWNNAYERLILNYRARETARQSENTALATRTVLTEKDFVIRNHLPGVYQSSSSEPVDSIRIDIGSGAALTFRPESRRDAAYVLTAIDGERYKAGSRIQIGGQDFLVGRAQKAILLFNEKNALKVFRQTIAAEGQRVQPVR